MRPVDLARSAGVSHQTVCNDEAQGIIPLADRSPHGNRHYQQGHLDALMAFLGLTRAAEHAPAKTLLADRTTVRDLEAVLSTSACRLFRSLFGLIAREPFGRSATLSARPTIGDRSGRVGERGACISGSAHAAKCSSSRSVALVPAEGDAVAGIDLRDDVEPVGDKPAQEVRR